MSDDHYEQGKKEAVRGFILLGVVTLIEVGIALLGKGYIIEGFHINPWIMYVAMILLSLYKAYFIVNVFMHMKYEVRGLVMTVILPLLLLVWAIIAFMAEGRYWKNSREKIKQKNELKFVGEKLGENVWRSPDEITEIKAIK